MRLLSRLAQHWLVLLACIAALLGLALLWLVHSMPLQPAPIVRIDALSAFFIFALLAGVALVLITQASAEGAPYRTKANWRVLTTIALLLIAWTTTLTPLVVVAYLLMALLSMQPTDRPPLVAGGPVATPQMVGAIRRALRAAPRLVAAAALLVGYGALAMRGALRYDTRTAGAALDGFAFWFVLLAAVIPATRSPVLFQIAWLYPLVRLYSLGPWNSGWSFAALLLGGSAALWAALAALLRPGQRRQLTLHSYQGMALAGFGLSSGAGVAASCYAVLACLVLALPATTDPLAPSPAQPFTRSLAQWLLSGAVPFTAPFAAAWMLVGASVAGGVALLAGLAWLAMLLNSLATALARDTLAPDQRRPLLIAAGASLLLGVAAPLVALTLIQPVVEQLQGGLTPYGDVNIWPWIGLASVDATRAQVTTLPSIAVAALMLVLSALVYLIARLRDTWAPTSAAVAAVAPAPHLRELLASLRAEVPWLAALGPQPADEEQGVDGE